MTMPCATPTLRVLLPAPLADAYDYLPPEGEMPAVGAFVEVPFGNRRMIGVVWGAGTGDVPVAKLKRINHTLDLRPVHEVSRAFVDWVAGYTLTPRGAVLKMLSGSEKIIEVKKKDAFDCPRFDPDYHQPHLSDNQGKTAEVLKSKLTEPSTYSTTLLDGVTGSGKTEVFCEAIAECLRQDRQALVLLPEIAMTAALIDRLTARFGARPIEWHSGLSDKQRRLHWQAIARGEAKFVLGARSALF